MASLAGAAAALALLSTPVGLLEMIAASIGLSEILPAAAPPLGLKARAIMAAFAWAMTFGLVAALGRETNRAPALTDETGRANRAAGDSIMGFALSKLTAFARGRSGPVKSPMRAVPSGEEEQAAPALRRADAHPDAPARAPIFASRDFGGLDIFPQPAKQVEEAEPMFALDSAPQEEQAGLALSRQAAPFDAVPDAPADAAPLAVSPEIEAPEAFEAPVTAEPFAQQPPATRASEDVETLSLTELTDRLERGLRKRMSAQEPQDVANPATDGESGGATVLAAMPPAQPVPVRSSVADEVDGALRAALGTLRGITGRTR